MNRIHQFWRASAKVFDLPLRLRAILDQRRWPLIPTPCLSVSLFLGALLRLPSLLQLQQETARPGWQRLIRYPHTISDDAFAYALEQARPQDWRAVLVAVNQTLKRNKVLESAKIAGLLVVAIDGNEQFKSRARCCADCCQRHVTETDAAGQTVEVVEYYHRFVCAQIHGPEFSVILDVEPLRPGEDEAAAALRLLGRLRRLYGPRFFDAVTVDAWYATGPFIKAVQRLGWGVISVLKQQRYDIYQEATALLAGQTPRSLQQQGRQIELREVKDLTFTDPAIGSVRVVAAQERWRERRRVGGKWVAEDRRSSWRWLVDRTLDGYSAEVIWRIGHQRWGVENHAFNELTQYYHLEHCGHHEPVAIVTWLLILVLAFVVFEWFARLHGKLVRMRVTLQEIGRQLDLSLARWEELEPLWSG
jgi:hypothetical protein